jgi:hypothetical protein
MNVLASTFFLEMRIIAHIVANVWRHRTSNILLLAPAENGEYPPQPLAKMDDWQQVNSSAGTYYWNRSTGKTTQVGAPNPSQKSSNVTSSSLETRLVDKSITAGVQVNVKEVGEVFEISELENPSIDISSSKKTTSQSKNTVIQPSNITPQASSKSIPLEKKGEEKGMYIVVFKNGTPKQVIEEECSKITASGTFVPFPQD